jgi:hypothetical protein
MPNGTGFATSYLTQEVRQVFEKQKMILDFGISSVNCAVAPGPALVGFMRNTVLPFPKRVKQFLAVT